MELTEETYISIYTYRCFTIFIEIVTRAKGKKQAKETSFEQLKSMMGSKNEREIDILFTYIRTRRVDEP